ncbi:hypothetical protein KAFR_0L00190 [Kazachstania africana CBS 2517]|uniref:Uncharacterized protein n=1 Tax=Kazachstania africana (strain ATCC 22294 / BCRC 22015 / CBS 2517 / CECT 1963 / NBRC 1671 / NRRL Y-8276) TaxID=1071382 RepID=H2B1X6_KAZAF|nr:hypothetical protein KAFR_0L00190 [Kazachstania africana CBS 2517]CCF60626.1 hypothetical protein KAFR_0L00190 [Kazachstania africana CBS 2517]
MTLELNNTAPISSSWCPLWNYDDITECGRLTYIDGLLPETITILASLTVIYNISLHYYRYNVRRLTREPTLVEILTNFKSDSSSESQPLLRSDTTNYMGETSVDDKETIKKNHFSIERIELKKLNGEPHGIPKLFNRDYIERSRLIIEFFLAISQMVIHFSFATRQELFPIWPLFQWTVLSAIVVLRLINYKQSVKFINKYLGNLWCISLISYMFLFFSMVLPFRSIIIGHINDTLVRNYYISQFLIDTCLFSLLFFAPIKNSPAVVYSTDTNITPSPEPITSLASFITWSWLDSFVWKAHKSVINKDDVWGLIMEDYSIFVVKKFKRFVRNLDERKFSFNLLYYFTNYIMLQTFCACIGAVFAFFPSLLLKRILEYVEDQSSAPANLVWFYVICMFSSKLFVAIANGQALFFGRRVCIRMKGIIISEIYSKALRRKVATSSKDLKAEKRDVNTTEDVKDPQKIHDKENINGDEESIPSAKLGAVINLMAVDSFKISEICAYLHLFIGAIVMVVVALTLLFKLIGYAAFVGVLVILIVLPINFYLANWLGRLQRESLAFTDKRIQKLNETFQAIRIIKFFSWEDNFSSDIDKIREGELNLLLWRAISWAISGFVWYLTPSIVTTASFTFYIYVQGEVLTTPVAFTALSLFSLLRDPLDRLSDMLSFVIQSKVSLDRVQDFLNEEDTDKYNQLTVATNKNQIAFKNTTVAWDNSRDSFKLRNLNIDFKVGKLNVIIGPTGSGKTSLLMALLGEMNLLEGQIVVPALNARHDLIVESDGTTNSIAYCSQAAWLLNDTVRNNILFNSPYNETRYHNVVEACGLRRDFEILKAGDMTEIGEKGIALSGGQKQRISLARALYSNSRHVLLDDCLSAVDAHTALWVYDNCITGPLMEGRTCILVSHNIALTLRNADLVVMLEDGQVKDQGTPMTLLEKGLLGEDELVKSTIMSRPASSANIANNRSTVNLTGVAQPAGVPKTDKKDKTDVERIEDGKLVNEETKAEGVVGLQVYSWYAAVFGGTRTLIFLAMVFVLSQLVYIEQSWWVRSWVTKNTITTLNYLREVLPSNWGAKSNPNHYPMVLSTISFGATVSKQKHSNAYYLTIYFCIGLLQSIVGAAKTLISYYFGINASRKIFRKLLDKVLHAKLRFFDSTPIGRIMNRFSKDMEGIDQDLAPYFQGAFYSFIECITTIILITFITPQFLSVAIIVGMLYYMIGYFYLTGSRELKRLDSITKSPIYQHFSETLVGVTTIRAFGDESRFLRENLLKIDENNRPFFYLWVANRWLSFRIDVIGALVVFGSGIFILTNINTIDSGMAGISLTYAISFTEGALWLVRFYSEVEMNMNSVERVHEYMTIEQEPYDEVQVSDSKVPADWPEEGRIEVSDLSLRYAAHLPKVIKNVTFNVDPRAKVGVVGRTGAGKSTIITALFRFLEAETGYIKIDGLDITSVNLTRLRRSITIIPQDPTLFSGTIKSNLDPYDEYKDEEVFEALRRVNLVTEEELSSRTENNNDEASVSSKNINRFLDLESEIAEGGTNFSQGQRQLICLARSLLRSPKILLLDEATASIDYDSDAKVQETIRTEFSESTILTIAHRLRSVIDYDKILVMGAGEVKEYDHPYSLLLNKNSIFYSMCENSGELDVLIDMSKEAFVRKLNSK